MDDSKNYAVLITEEAAVKLEKFAGQLIRRDVAGIYLYAKRVELSEPYYCHLWLRNLLPDANGQVLEFELHIPHSDVTAIFYVAEPTNLRGLGFTADILAPGSDIET